MAITARQAGAGVGGASLGVVGAEAIQHADNRDIVGERAAHLAAAGIGVGTVGIAAGTAAGVVPLPAEAAATIGGYGVGSSAWYAAREVGLAPRLTVDIPAEVNLADPLVTAAVIGTVGVAAGTVVSFVL